MKNKIIKFILYKIRLASTRFGCIVVITSALHAEGRGFDPRLEYITFTFFKLFYHLVPNNYCQTEISKLQ